MSSFAHFIKSLSEVEITLVVSFLSLIVLAVVYVFGRWCGKIGPWARTSNNYGVTEDQFKRSPEPGAEHARLRHTVRR